MDIIQIKPVRLRIDIDKASQIARRRKHTIHVDIVGSAHADQTAGRVTENRDMAVLHRPYHAFGLRLARKIKKRVYRGHHYVQLFDRKSAIEAAHP